MGDHPNLCDFVEPFQDLSYLFIGLTLWFVICLKAFVERGKIGFKIGPGVLGLMLRMRLLTLVHWSVSLWIR